MPADPDPHQTFAGAPPPRKRGPLGPLLIAVSLVVGIGLIIAWTLNQYLPKGTFSLASLTGRKPAGTPVPEPSPPPPVSPAPAAESSPTPTESPAASVSPTPAVADASPAASPTPALPETLEASPDRSPAVAAASPPPRRTATPAPSPTVVARAEPPPTPAPSPLKIEAGGTGLGDAPLEPPVVGAPPTLPVGPPPPEEKAGVREEVLRRIGLMPDLKPEDREKLYSRVDRNQGMERVSTIPFETGETRPRPADVDRLRAELSSPAARRFLEDPTVVIVVLGYADPAGAPEANKALSNARARSTIATLRGQLRVNSVMHGVGMGASTLFGEGRNQRNRNRLVEIWAVLP